jgi:hypothetical protein
MDRPTLLATSLLGALLGGCSSNAAPADTTDAGCPPSGQGCAPDGGQTSDGGTDSTPGDSGADSHADGGHMTDGGPPPGVDGKSWYVAKGAPGTAASACSAAGTSWTTAWGEMNAINWSCLQPGDTLWIAGGTYAHGFAVGASGTASHPIYVARPLSTDSVPTQAAGWNAAFDSQVVITNPNADNANASCNKGDVLCFGSSTLGNYTYWDGRVDAGIKLQTSNIAGLSPTNNTTIGQSAADLGPAGNNHDVTFTNVDFAGPAGPTEYDHLSYDAAIQVVNAKGNILFSNCRFHGGNENVNISGSSGVVFDHCKFYDQVAGPNSAGHGNQVQYASNDDVTFRFNEWWNWSVEGIMVWTPSGSLYVYGNVFHDADNSGYPSVIQAQAAAGPLYFYNNTIANVTNYCVFRPDPAGSWTAGSQARNNLYWTSDVCIQIAPGSDYDAYYDDMTASNPQRLGIPETTTVQQAETHSCTVPAAPFANEGAGDFHLTSNTVAGVDLGAPYDVDKDGNPRTTWTRGAYEHP